MRILIAEDDPISRRTLQAAVEAWGHHPLVVSNGDAAWKILESPGAPRLMILDWVMPGVEGTELVRRVRILEKEKSDENPNYIMLLTARDATADLVEGFAAGADDYIRKPFHRDELKARVEVGARMLELRERLSERVRELEEAVTKVRTLQGLLPMCSYCKKIRDDQNYWTEVESYLVKFSDAELSHGVCPDCFDRHLKADLDQLKR